MNNNKLIAEFMGYEVKHGKCYSPKYNDGTIAPMQFHKSWDWLMPVVERIESHTDNKGDAYRFTIDMCNTHIEGTGIETIGASKKFDAVYQSVVEFIKEYNK